MPDVLLWVPMAVVVLAAVTVHEFAHGWTADRCGDPTARLAGRVTLNPIVHIDWIGALCLFLFKFGWAKPVPVDARNFRHPRRDMVLVSAAGPGSNFLMAVLLVLVWRGAPQIFPAWDPDAAGDRVFEMVLLAVHINIGLALFNLLPIPPLDGSKILYSFLPDRWIALALRYERSAAIVLIVLLVLGAFTFLGAVRNRIVGFLFNV